MITFYGLIVRCKLFIGRSCKWVGSEGYLCICANKKAWTVIERMKRNGNREERRRGGNQEEGVRCGDDERRGEEYLGAQEHPVL